MEGCKPRTRVVWGKRRQDNLRYYKIKAADSRMTIMNKRVKLGSTPNHLKINPADMLEREHSFDKVMGKMNSHMRHRVRVWQSRQSILKGIRLRWEISDDKEQDTEGVKAATMISRKCVWLQLQKFESGWSEASIEGR